MFAIRPLQGSDHAQLLRINAAHLPAVAALDAGELHRIASIGQLHRVAVAGDAGAEPSVLGYLLAFESGAQYDGEEFRHFSARLRHSFLYIDQVAIAASARRQGIARALYESLAVEARGRRCALLCCEVNTVPPNPGSMTFHRRLGFEPLDVMAVADGRTVALLTRSTLPFS